MNNAAPLSNLSSTHRRATNTHVALSPRERDWPWRSFSILDEVLGPDFHGPSSSHTAGPQLIALEVHRVLGGVPETATVQLYNSFAATGEGHLVTTDPKTPTAQAIASGRGLEVQFESVVDPGEHPNTLVIETVRGGFLVRIKAISVGGGYVEILEMARTPRVPTARKAASSVDSEVAR
jgi:iron-sulfur-dependent L-serine dehydratase beta subunit